MKIIFLVIGCCSLPLQGFAQDSTQVSPQAFSRGLAEQFSQTRILDIQYGMMGSRDFGTEILGNDLEKGNIETTQDLQVNINLPIIQKKRWKLTYSGQYTYQNYNYAFPNAQNTQIDLHYLNSGVSFTYFSSLFKKSIIYNTSLFVDGSDKMFGRATGLITATMVLKRKPNSSMTVGLVGIIDPTNNVPILPTFSYSTKLFKDKYNLDIVLPSQIMLRTRLGKTGRISLGTELETSSFYLENNKFLTNTNEFEFRQTGLKSGLTYEYLIKQKFVLTAKAGLLNVFQSRISEKGERFNNDNYLIDFEPEPTGYFSVGISFNPF